ncbi:MAG: hypothetical protein GX569_11075 [Candidatus Riflebacteria bacterium]|nr:hypothetical protein [Candidatus Riflebacteria bacterium]
MMPIFMSPLAFWGLLALAAVTAIYLFRRQSRNIRVSSLMFWSHVKVPAEGGRKITRLQIPIVLVLELLILVLLVLAAATPRAVTGDQLVPVALILDDSLSMSAGSGETARSRALAWLDKNILARNFVRLTMIRAGVEPEIIGRSDLKAAEASHLIGGWRCRSPYSDLNAALRNVSEICSPDTRVLVVTDRTTQQVLADNISWLSFGQPLANIAITTANRYALGDVDRCFFEFVNFATAPARLQAEIVNAGNGTVLERLDLELAARSHRRVRLSVKDTEAEIRALVKSDGIDYDNQAWLLPVRPEPVSVELASLSARLRPLLERTLTSSGLAAVVASGSHLAFFEGAGEITPVSGRWNFVIHNATQPVTVRGSVAVDKNHPLLGGLPKVLAAWAFDRNFSVAGQPLMSVAGVPLLIAAEDSHGDRTIFLNLTADRSNLHATAVWPVFFWNLLNWRQQANPGPTQFNYRSGMEVKVNLPTGVKNLKVISPSGRETEIPVWRRNAGFIVREPGIYSLQSGEMNWKTAANLNSVEESDLTGLQTSLPEIELASGDASRYFSDVRWWFIVPALLLLILHQWLLRQGRPGHVY